MPPLMLFARRLLVARSGVTAIEYGLIAALIAIVVVTVLSTVGSSLTNSFNTVVTSF